MDTSGAHTNRIHWIDILRGISILLMVYGHINYAVPVYTWIYSFHMALFFFASGAVYKQRPLFQDFLHRARTVVLPYFIYGVITLLYWQLAERHYKPSALTFTEAWRGLLYAHQDKLDFNIPLWFLPCFFVTLILYNLIRNIFGKHLVYAVIFCGAVSIVYAKAAIPALPWGVDRIPQYILFVALGELAVTQTRIRIRESKTTLAFIGAVAFAVLSVLCAKKLPYMQTPAFWFLTAAVGCGFVIWLSLFLMTNRVLEYCGRISLTILCLHGAVYRALIYQYSELSKKTMEQIRSAPYTIILFTCISVLFCAAIRQIGISVKKRLFEARFHK